MTGDLVQERDTEAAARKSQEKEVERLRKENERLVKEYNDLKVVNGNLSGKVEILQKSFDASLAAPSTRA